ncbi:MAG: hypothetical protein KGQ59_10035 [Bdellovibrionales bacterium]|nr:hypothetical protein [Bdellovibrionales bacterium]
MVKWIGFERHSGSFLGKAIMAASVVLLGASGSLASIPQSRLVAPRTVVPRDEIVRDQRVSEQMTELEISRENAPDFESDLARLSTRERQYRERLPGLSGHSRLKSVVSRVSAQPYRSLKQ